MNISLLIRFLFCLALACACMSAPARAQEAVRVGVLPFQIYAADREKTIAWPFRVARTLSAELQKDEQILLVGEDKIRAALERAGPAEVDEALAREIGQKVEADYMVLGSVTQIDGSISLDIRVLDAFQQDALVPIFRVGKSAEELEAITLQASREVKLRILKKEILAKILIEGNRAIEESAIRAQIKVKEGDSFSPSAVREDLKTLYQMGFFQDVRVEKRDWERGKALVFVVQEKPIVKEVVFTGNKEIKTSDLMEVVDIKPRSVLNLNAVKENINKILKKYREEAYFAAEVQYDLESTPRPGEVIVHFRVKENEKVRIRKISFSGNVYYSDAILRKLLPETKEEGWFSWFTKSGIYKEDILERDLDAIVAFYFQKGFIQVKVGRPKVTIDKEGIWINIPVEEGRQFKIGKVDIQGDLMLPKEEMLKRIPVYVGEIFNRDHIRDSLTYLTDLYADQGYAFVDVNPMTVPHKDQPLVDLTFEIRQGSKVYFERINILGNTKTRDRVIRRDLLTVEGDLYSLTAMKRSRDQLNALGYFKEVNINTKKGSADDKMEVNVQVEEAPTGSFSGGVGYSSIDKLVAIISLSQNNLFGRGHRVAAQAQLGSISRYFNLSFTEPRLFDTQVLVGADAYNTYRDYDDYSVKKQGAVVRFGFPIYGFLRGILQYKYEKADTYNIRENASQIIEDEEGITTTSSISGVLRRDTRNHRFDPTRGSDNTFSMEYAGGFLGGTNEFNKYIFNSAWFITPFYRLTFSARGRIGYITGDAIPLYELFRLGGMYSVRGFKAWSIGPTAPNGEVIGGDKELLFNFEMLFPIAKEINLKGLIFFDAGNAWAEGDPYQLDDLRTSAGFGFRWMSPVGPLRLEWGYNLKPKPGESQSTWDFTIGGFL
ncbi:MAG: outer membrane protein assembly factor BamA [Syntrophaceae bacterium]|nr:outer membrane protein assembly factor BamA [Syntrophaceae bacterium]